MRSWFLSLFRSTAVSPWSFQGKVRYIKADTAASLLFANSDLEINITKGSSTIHVGRDAWTICGTYDKHTIYGETDDSDVSFVICRGPEEIVGIICNKNIGDSQDPGTWEADRLGPIPNPG